MNMRKSLFLLALCALCGWNVAHAQWSVTPKAGVNVTKESGSPAKIGYKVGAAVRYEFENSGFSLQSGLYFTQRGRGVNRSLNLWGDPLYWMARIIAFLPIIIVACIMMATIIPVWG